MARKIRLGICSGCLESFNYDDLYWVDKLTHFGNPEHGIYRSPRCEECIKDTDSYISIFEKPKNKK